jgi:hypothetical protein
MRCLKCKYDLSHLAEHRCPECGRVFNPLVPQTYESGERRADGRLVGTLLLLALVSTLILFLWLVASFMSSFY